MSFRFANIAGRASLIDDSDQFHDLERLTSGSFTPDPMAALARTAELHDAARTLAGSKPDGSMASAQVLSPVPNPRNVFAVGLNYKAHAAEAGMDLPDTPIVFTKFPSCITGPTANIELRSETTDWEIELVVVMGTVDGRPGRDIPQDQAWDHILGLTIGQDISDRVLQFAASPPQFALGKSRDGYGPLGPVLVSPDSFDDPTNLAITCDINGDRKQDDRTSNLIFSIAELVSYLSNIVTLQAGDIIFTGTPEGVGMASGTFLKPDDQIVSTIEGIGTMSNTCTI